VIPTERIRGDFDRIARLTDKESVSPYDPFLLAHIPLAAKRILDIGCGSGTFARSLAARGHRVTAIDLSPEMIRRARERTPEELDISYLSGDVMATEIPGAPFDCVISINTLHHLPIAAAVRRMAELTAPGGMLIVHDVRNDAGLGDRLRSLTAFAARLGRRIRTGEKRQSKELRAAWREHGEGESYLTMPKVAEWSRTLLPGSQSYRHCQWRYTVTWMKP